MDPARTPPELIGEAPAFLDALAHASTAAALDRPLLVVGERGAGKELIAARIHFLSPRWEGPFVKVNCAALSTDLLESELFGHEAGAFTGAQKRHLGRFERAEGGTLFLDEIASASLRVQEKLLRVIEYGEFERLGGDQTLIADVRVVAAANVNLPSLARSGAFRADLLDRLAFDVVSAPPLRDRKDDIPLLAAHFGAMICSEIGAAFPGFSAATMAAFLAHDWPGNVRELKNAAERSAYRWIAAGEAGPVDVAAIDPFATSDTLPDTVGAAPEPARNPQRPPSSPTPPSSTYDFRKWLDRIEKEAVSAALREHGWSQTKAASALRLTYDQIRGLIRKHKISIKNKSPRKIENN
ncbi:MAG: phage shock protein operon transcriptional activator [Pseudomonadota bacterium]